MTDITWNIAVPGEMWCTNGVPGGEWTLTWKQGVYELIRIGSRGRPIQVEDMGLHSTIDVATEYIEAMAVTVPYPDHPLARFRAGAARGSMHKMYFGGYFWSRIHNGKLTAVYRPTVHDDQYGMKAGQVGFMTWDSEKVEVEV